MLGLVVLFSCVTSLVNAHTHRVLIPHMQRTETTSSCDGAAVCLEEFSSIASTVESKWWVSEMSVANDEYNRFPPLFVLAPNGTEEIRRIMSCAYRTNTPVSVKGGGHNYAGFSQGLPTGMQLNLQKMCNISNATIEFGVPAIRVGPGCVFDNVYRYLQSFWPSKNLAGGFCPLVGVSGFHLGGGIGPLTREFGIGADSVLQATVVTVNGSAVVTANANSNADLFFALRGGAGGSFGVVTEWVLAVHPSQPLYSYGEYCPEDGLESFRAALLNLANVINTTPNWLTISWRFVNNPASKSYGLCFLYYSLRGSQETMSWMQANGVIPMSAPKASASFPIVPDNDEGASTDHPGNFLVEFKSLLEMELANAQFKGYAQFGEIPFYNRNCVLQTFNSTYIEVILQQWLSIPAYSTAPCYVQGLPLAMGNAALRPSDATAFPFRNAAFASDAECEFSTKTGQDIANAWTLRHVQTLEAANLCAGAFVNFPYRDLPNFPTKYWASNAARLMQVRKTWNPTLNNPLKFEQQVPFP